MGNRPKGEFTKESPETDPVFCVGVSAQPQIGRKVVVSKATHLRIAPTRVGGKSRLVFLLSRSPLFKISESNFSL